MDGSASAHPVPSPWSRCPEDVLKALEVFPGGGVGSSEAERRLEEYRFNGIRGAKSESPRANRAEQSIAQLCLVFSTRAQGSGLLRNDTIQNLYFCTALGLCVGLLLAALCLPGSTDLLRTSPPGPMDWALVLSMSLVPLAIVQVLKDTMGIGL